jgi:hypothetical protein
MVIDRKKIALIHIVKKELNLDDAAYRKVLIDQANVASANKLDEAGFRKLMNYFVRSPYYQVNNYGLTIKQKLYIKSLAGSLQWEEGHLNNFLNKYYHKKDISQLSRIEASHVIESLKNVKQHVINRQNIPLKNSD